MPRQLTTTEFISKAKKKHREKYEYPFVNYKNSKEKIKIICSKHGEFEQIPAKHLSGQGCPKCCKNSKKEVLEYIKEFKVIHNNRYDYNLIYNINSAHQKISIICSIHGLFKQTVNSHKNGNGCLKCYHNSKKLTLNKFIQLANLKHNNKYDYSNVEYINNYTKTKIICSIHGEFCQEPRVHLNGSGCPVCNESKGELKIRKFLISNRIKFIPQYKFPDCKSIKLLLFDFYLPDYNTCIEYNGKQHYKPIQHFGGKTYFNVISKRDNIKKQYCLNNNINLFTISYNENVEEKLTDFVSLKAASFTSSPSST